MAHYHVHFYDKAFDPKEHPTAPEGAPGGKGGQFVKKGTSAAGATKPAKAAKAEVEETKQEGASKEAPKKKPRSTLKSRMDTQITELIKATLERPNAFRSKLGGLTSFSGMKRIFPRLKSEDYKVVGPATNIFNCMAWAVGISNKWITFDYVFNAEELIMEYGGRRSDTNTDYEPGFIKIAMMSVDPKKDEFSELSHMMRQQSDGTWMSKCGGAEMIGHQLTSLDKSKIYGNVVSVFKISERGFLKMRRAVDEAGGIPQFATWARGL